MRKFGAIFGNKDNYLPVLSSFHFAFLACFVKRYVRLPACSSVDSSGLFPSPLIQRANVRGVTMVISSWIALPSGLPCFISLALSAGVSAIRLGSLLRS
jgi:hypothetical protein